MNEIFDELQEFSNRIRSLMGNSIRKIIVYGSYARGDYNSESDVDIMILTSLSDNEIRSIENEAYDIAFDFLMDYGINISVIIKNEIEFNYWLGALPFYNNVRDEGVVISD